MAELKHHLQLGLAQIHTCKTFSGGAQDTSKRMHTSSLRLCSRQRAHKVCGVLGTTWGAETLVSGAWLSFEISKEFSGKLGQCKSQMVLVLCLQSWG